MDPLADAHHASEPDAQAGLWLYAVVFVAGACLMSLELVGSRLLAPYFGNSIYVWGSLIGVFLAALSIGYTVGGRLADRAPTSTVLATVLAAAALLTAAIGPCSDFVQSAVVHADPGIRLDPLLSAIILFGPASVLLGTVAPLAVRLRVRDVATAGSEAGTLYGISTAGSIAGTIGTAFWLIQSVGSTKVVLLIAASLAACGVVAARASYRRSVMAFTTLTLLGTLLVLGSDTGLANDSVSRHGDWSPVFRAGGYRGQFEPIGNGTVHYHRDSQYHRIRVVDYQSGVGAIGPTRIMHFDNSIQAGIPLKDGKPDGTAPPLFHYLRAFDLIPAVRPDINHVLFLGLGSGAAVMRLHQLRPDVKIDVVEIDPKVVKVARKWFGYAPESATVHTHVGDARSWLAASNDHYDAIVIDAYFADALPFHLTTREFLQVVRNHLTRNGVVAANLVGAVEGGKSSLLRSMLRTYRTQFPVQAIYPVPNINHKLELRNFSNVELLATRGSLPPPGAEEAMLRKAGIVDALDPVLREILAARYTAHISGAGVPTLTDDYAPVDQLIIVNTHN